MKYPIYLSIFLFLFLSFNLFSQNLSVEMQMKNLVTRWEERDGNQFIEIGFELSKFFVQNDSIFLCVMSKNRQSFSSWLNKLQYTSFTAYEAGNDEVERVLYTAFYNKLKELMCNKADKWIKSTEYMDISNEMISKLNTVVVRFID